MTCTGMWAFGNVKCVCVWEREKEIKVHWCEVTYSHFCLLIQRLVIQNARCMLLKYKLSLFPERMTFRMPGWRCKLSKQLQQFISDLSALSLAFSKKWLLPKRLCKKQIKPLSTPDLEERKKKKSNSFLARKLLWIYCLIAKYSEESK